MIDLNLIKDSFDEQYPCHSQAELAIFQAGFESGYLLGQQQSIPGKKKLEGKIVILFKGKKWMHDGVIENWIENNSYLVALHNALVGGYLPSQLFNFDEFTVRFCDDYQHFDSVESAYFSKEGAQ